MPGPDDVEVVETEPRTGAPASTALATREAAGMQIASPQNYPLAALSEAQFDNLLASMRMHNARVKKVQRELMEYGVHYGVPGMDEKAWKASGRSPALYKAGVELLLKLMRYVAETTYEVTYGDPTNALAPAVSVRATCRIRQDHAEGPIVAVGVATCNTWETKYRWRISKPKCPACGGDGIRFIKSARKGEFEGKPCWWCPADVGCGAEFGGDDERVRGQERGRVPNDAAMDLENTAVKIACKRSRSDGTILATQSSDIWTQDLEDLAANGHDVGAGDKREKKPEQKPPVTGPASDQQKSAVRNLLKSKRGLETDPQIDATLAEWFGVGVGLPSLTAEQAGAAIAKLNDEKPGAARPAAASIRTGVTPNAAVRDTEQNRAKLRASVLQVEALLVSQGHQARIEKDAHTDYLVDAAMLERIFKSGSAVSLDVLDVTQLASILTLLQDATHSQPSEATS